MCKRQDEQRTTSKIIHQSMMLGTKGVTYPEFHMELGNIRFSQVKLGKSTASLPFFYY
jgi:hypothetical protein